MKSYTDLPQSKKLAEILPLESADMRYAYIAPYIPSSCDDIVYTIDFGKPSDIDIPCWSLAALLSVLPYPSLHKTFSGWRCDSYNKEGTSCIMGNPSDNPIDTCYEMILMLHELEML